ncbi:MAG TPA: hypothetical protein G4N92_04235 [Anaerolineae bacterium]|nr:hypothetical protein [Anaerolineae bacterium]
MKKSIETLYNGLTNNKKWRDDSMTLIIGMYYNSSEGAIVVADSRTMRGGDYTQDKKLFRVFDDVVFAAAGYSGMVEKLLPKVEQSRLRRRQFLPGESLEIFEDEMAELSDRYKNTRPYRFSANDTLLNGIIGALIKGKPELHTLYDNGYAEIIHDFHAVGHGARHAQNILRTLYEPKMTKDRALEVAVHAIVEVSQVDAMVDDCPQIAVLEKGKDDNDGIVILNDIENGFEITCKKIQNIKDKVQGIELKRTKIFHMLLDSFGVDRIDKLIKEYKDASHNKDEKKDGGGGTRKGKTTTRKSRAGKKTA